jgi:two-component system NtrC family sensor kinase
MKTIKLICPFLFLIINFCGAQDKPVIISPKAFNSQFDFVPIDRMDGWYFRAGSDTAWAKSDISMAGWRKLSPLGLSAKYADKNGKVEGWFRITVKLDSSIKTMGLRVWYGSYAPADIYINGKRIGSAGNTGLYGHPYSEYLSGILTPGIPLNIKSGEQFTLALHLVDSLSPLPPRRLKYQITHPDDIIVLSGPDAQMLTTSAYLMLIKSTMLALVVFFSLSLLFWLLVLQNRRQKVFIYIAVWTTTAAFNAFFGLQQIGLKGLASLPYLIYMAAAYFTAAGLLVLVPVIIAVVFRRRLAPWIKIVLTIIFINQSLATFSLWSPALPIFLSIIFLAVLSMYYIISSWKTVRGAQWAIVAGAFGFASIFLISIILGLLFPGKLNLSEGIGYYLFTGMLLSFPVSLLVFVAMRFKEMLREVEQNAGEVVRLSEEKKVEALNRQKMLEKEVNRQTAEIKQTLEHLQSTQTQLIQREKMASLGELTAGIAHEIQNPLNFVNNFSEVSVELLDEMDEELDKGDIQEAKAIGADLKQNLQKIQHHGIRADFIVKGMLEHSRTNTGEKQLTDMNVLCDEFLKLSYHGLRAKDKSFNAEMVTHFDPKLPKINVSQQDMGRVMLNLFNNAFYAVNQELKVAGVGYKPEVTVTTAVGSAQVVIKVKDNGVGVPDAIKDKIMQPFFTTKPTGEGTGLGLSLTYDMVVKGHGGSISVDTKEGSYTEFTVSLPVL